MAVDDVWNSDGRLRVARVLHRTVAEGPGERSAVWVQGCSIRCPGCINAHLFGDGGTERDAVGLADEIIASGSEGVTLLGGEPFDQASACAIVAEVVRAAGLGVITFSGHTHAELVAGPPGWRRLLDATDLLVDGPYDHTRPDTERALVGSTNQRFVHLTERYRSFDPVVHPERLEVRVGSDGIAEVAGFLTRDQLRVLGGRTSRRARPDEAAGTPPLE